MYYHKTSIITIPVDNIIYDGYLTLSSNFITDNLLPDESDGQLPIRFCCHAMFNYFQTNVPSGHFNESLFVTNPNFKNYVVVNDPVTTYNSSLSFNFVLLSNIGEESDLEVTTLNSSYQTLNPAFGSLAD